MVCRSLLKNLWEDQTKSHIAGEFLPSGATREAVYSLVHVKLNWNVCSGSGTVAGFHVSSTFLCMTVMTSSSRRLIWSGHLCTVSVLLILLWCPSVLFKALVFGSVFYYLQIALLSCSARKVISNPALWRHCFLKLCSVILATWFVSPRGLAALFLLQPNLKASSCYAWSLKNFPFCAI